MQKCFAIISVHFIDSFSLGLTSQTIKKKYRRFICQDYLVESWN